MPPGNKGQSGQTSVQSNSEAKTAEKVDKDQTWVQTAINKNGWKKEWGQLSKRRVSKRIDIQKWSQVYYTFPNAVMMGSVDPHAHELSGRRLYIVCPTRWFPSIMSDEFKGCPYPPCPREDCPYHGKNKEVQGSGWTPLPRKITGMDEVAYAYASSWRCTGAGKRYAVLFCLTPCLS